MKKIIALVLSVVMVVCVFASCGAPTGTTAGGTTAGGTTAGGTTAGNTTAGSGTTAGTTGTNGTTAGTTAATTVPEPIVPKDESLLVWLDFAFDNLNEEGDVPYFIDMSGNENHGYVGGDIDVTDGYDGESEAAQFYTVGDYITIKHNDVFNFKAEDEYSIDLWFKVDTKNIYSNNAWPCLFTKGSPNATSYFGSWINNSKGTDSVYFGTGTFDIETNTNVTGNKNAAAMKGTLDEKWHHFVAVQKDGVIYTYVDGVAGVTETAKDVTSTWDIYLGGKVGEKDGVDSIQQFFGAIDEFKIYNRALTYSEIADIEIEKPEKEELVLDLDFANMKDGVVTDLSGKGNNGTVTGNITVADGAAKFDNTDENSTSYITIKNSELLQFRKGQSFTVQITFKYATALPTGWNCLLQAGLKGQGWYGVWHAGNTNIAWGGLGGNKYATKTAITVDTWHTMTVVQNSETGEIKTYFDGVEGESLIVQNYTFDGDIYLGAEITGLENGAPSTFGCKFNGFIKNVKIYNYALDMTAGN